MASYIEKFKSYTDWGTVIVRSNDTPLERTSIFGSLEDAKKLGPEALDEFTKDQQKFFDFQFFVKNDNNKTQFPIIGYKQRAKDSISWTKDRAES